ncbi:hypothetical protein V6Z12_D12G134800 [Gossypium hirsutum]
MSCPQRQPQGLLSPPLCSSPKPPPFSTPIQTKRNKGIDDAPLLNQIKKTTRVTWGGSGCCGAKARKKAAVEDSRFPNFSVSG